MHYSYPGAGGGGQCCNVDFATEIILRGCAKQPVFVYKSCYARPISERIWEKALGEYVIL